MERSIAGSVVYFILGSWLGHWYVILQNDRRVIIMLTSIAYQSHAAAVSNWYLLVRSKRGVRC